MINLSCLNVRGTLCELLWSLPTRIRRNWLHFRSLYLNHSLRGSKSASWSIMCQEAKFLLISILICQKEIQIRAEYLQKFSISEGILGIGICISQCSNADSVEFYQDLVYLISKPSFISSRSVFSGKSPKPSISTLSQLKTLNQQFFDF